MSSSALYQDALVGFKNYAQLKYTEPKDRELLDQFLSEQGTPEDSQAAARKLGQESSRKYDTRHISGNTRISQVWIQNILSNISNFVSAGNYVMEGAPDSVGLVWFGVTLTLKAIESDYNLYSLFGSGLTDITEFMVLVPHYDRLYGERLRPGSNPIEIVDKLFRDIVNAYTVILQFSFSVKRHIEAGKLETLKHGMKNLFGYLKLKFEEKIKHIASLKQSILEDTQAAFNKGVFDSFKSLEYTTSSMKSIIEDIYHLQPKMMEIQREQTELLNELVHTVKAKTPRGSAMQEFERIKTRLNVAPNDTLATLERLRSARLTATSQWIFECDEYLEWEKSKFNSVLSLVGAKGSGKSTILASVHQQLSDRSDRDHIMALFASCDVDSLGTATNKRSPKLNTICSTLYLQVLQHACDNVEDESLLDSCNKVFAISKNRFDTDTDSKAAKSTNQKEEHLPKFEDAIFKLASLLRTDICIILDAVEALDDQDQIELYKMLEAIFDSPTSASPQQVRTIVACPVTARFQYEFRSFKMGNPIDANRYHRSDMEMKITHELKNVPGCSEAETADAVGKVLDKAGHDFGYVANVALPYLKEPSTERFCDRLKRLPEGMKSVYDAAFGALSSNYANLLRVAVSWALFTPGNDLPTIEEVNDAFYGTYDGAAKEEYSDGVTIKTGFPVATKLFREQLERVSGPFLRLVGNYINLQDWDQIPCYCKNRADHHEHQEIDSTGKYCDRCKMLLSQPRSLGFDEKDEHLRRALTCIRHLNNPLFQKRAGLLEASDPTEESDSEARATEHETSDGASDTSNNIPSPQPFVGQDSTSDVDTVATNKPEKDRATESTTQVAPDGNDDSGYLWTGSSLIPAREESHIRYEIIHWPFHLRWAEEREESIPGTPLHDTIWAEILTELEILTSNKVVFNNWQRKLSIAKGQDAEYLSDPQSPVHVAAYLGLVRWAKLLIEQGQDPTKLSTGRTALQAAAEKAERRPMLKLLLEHGGDVNFQSDSHIPAFHSWLCDDSALETIQLIMDHGGNPKLPNGRTHPVLGNWTPMHYFAWFGENPEALELLLSRVPEEDRPGLINTMTPNKWTPLLVLLERENVPKLLLEAFLDHGADINVDGSRSLRALQMACVNGDLECVRTILEHKVEEIDDPDDDGNTALHQVCLNGHRKCLGLLIDRDANINLRNNLQRTPLHVAAFRGFPDCVRILLEKSADPHCFDSRGRTPLFAACLSESQEAAKSILAGLIDANHTVSEINNATKRDRTPLRQASYRGFDEVVALIIKTAREKEDIGGLDVNRQDKLRGMGALHVAAKRGHVECVRLLLEIGAEASVEAKDGETALVLAYKSWSKTPGDGFQDIISMLIERQPEAAKADTELHAICAVNGSTRLLEQLQDLGADLHRQDRYGWTPLELAMNANQTEVQSLLRKRGVLPARWLADSRADLLSEDGLVITNDRQRGGICISTDRPLPPNIDKYYFEVTFLGPAPSSTTATEAGDGSNDGHGNECAESVDHNNNDGDGKDTEQLQKKYPVVAIGFCTLGGSAFQFLGWPPRPEAPAARSWGYHGDDGGFFSSAQGPRVTWVKAGPQYGLIGDTVGCGVDYGVGAGGSGTVWFTHNGRRLGQHEFTGVRGRLFPALGLRDKVRLETRFGGEFRYRGARGRDGKGGA